MDSKKIKTVLKKQKEKLAKNKLEMSNVMKDDEKDSKSIGTG